MERNFKLLVKLDWTLAICTIIVGLYLLDWLVLGAGVLGLGVAWYGPAARMKVKLEGHFLKRRAVRDDTVEVTAQDAFYAGVLGNPDPSVSVDAVQEPGIAQPADFSRAVAPYGPMRLGVSRHNQLKPASFNLARGSSTPPWC